MAKIDLDTNDDALLANANRYNELFFKVGKSSAEDIELSNLQALLQDYIQTASDFNTINTLSITNQTNITTNVDNISNIFKIYQAGGTASAITVDTDEHNFFYEDGRWVQVEITASGTISTASVDSGTATTVQDKEGNPLEVVVGDIIILKYDSSGTPFFLGASRGGGTDTSDATATAGDILLGKTAYAEDKITGTIPSKGVATITPSTTNQVISSGQYLSGNQTIVGDADLVSGNIKAGKNIFGVSGSSNVVDTSAGNLNASYLLTGYQGYSDGGLVVGTLANRLTGNYTATIITKSGNALYFNMPALGCYGTSAKIAYTDNDWVEANIKTGVNVFGKTGTFTSDATASAGDIYSGQTAYKNGVKLTGTMPAYGGDYASDATSSSSTTIYLGVPNAGYYTDASRIYATDSNFISSNIKSGVTLFGKTSTMPSKGATTYTPSTSTQTISSGQYLTGTQTISGDADLVASNIISGKNIFGVAGTATERLYAEGTATTASFGSFTVSGLGFTPKVVVCQQSAGATGSRNVCLITNSNGITANLTTSDFTDVDYRQAGGTLVSGGFTAYMWSSSSGLSVDWFAFG